MTVKGSGFNRVLVPFDGSASAEQALRFVSSFVDESTEIVLLHILSNLSADAIPGHRGESENESSQPFHQYAIGALSKRRGQTETITVSLEVTDGWLDDEILSVARARQVNLIVLASDLGEVEDATDPTEDSVVKQVVSRSPVPVLVVRAHDPVNAQRGRAETDIRRIVVPLDGSDRAAQALPFATVLARRLGVPIHLLTVLDLASCGSLTLAREAARNVDLYRELFADVELDAKNTLSKTGEALLQQGFAVSLQLRVGPVVDTIMDVTDDSDVIVMTSRGRGGGRQWPIGSVAERLIAESAAPVLLVPSVPEEDVVVSANAEESHRTFAG